MLYIIFSVWLKIGSNPADINRFWSHTGQSVVNQGRCIFKISNVFFLNFTFVCRILLIIGLSSSEFVLWQSSSLPAGKPLGVPTPSAAHSLHWATPALRDMPPGGWAIEPGGPTSSCVTYSPLPLLRRPPAVSWGSWWELLSGSYK